MIIRSNGKCELVHSTREKVHVQTFLTRKIRLEVVVLAIFHFLLHIFTPTWGDEKIDQYFSNGLEPPTRKEKIFFKHTIIEAGASVIFTYFHTQTVEQESSISPYISTTLPETNSKFAPENGWLEYDLFPFGAFRPIFRCFCR